MKDKNVIVMLKHYNEIETVSMCHKSSKKVCPSTLENITNKGLISTYCFSFLVMACQRTNLNERDDSLEKQVAYFCSFYLFILQAIQLTMG